MGMRYSTRGSSWHGKGEQTVFLRSADQAPVGQRCVSPFDPAWLCSVVAYPDPSKYCASIIRADRLEPQKDTSTDSYHIYYRKGL